MLSVFGSVSVTGGGRPSVGECSRFGAL